MNELQNIKIIGGGISGLSTALALKTKEIGSEIKNFHFVDQNLKYIKSFIMDKSPLSVNRRLFYELFKDLLDKDKIYLNSKKTVDDFSQKDIVISADGIQSVTRKQLYPELKIRDSHQILWRGITKIELDNKFKNSYHDFIGNSLRFAIIHSGKDYYSWYIVKEKGENDNLTLDKEILKSYFKNYHPIVGEVIENSKNIYFSEMLDINPIKRKNLDWFVKNNLMIGDAIHPTTPNMANGACLAIEDAYLLANLLENKNTSIKSVFTKFQKRRTKKINPIVNQSWRLGKLLHQKSGIMDSLVKIAIKTTPKWLFDRIYSNVLIEETT